MTQGARLVVEKGETMAVRTSDDVVRVRQAVRARAIEARFGIVDQTKLVTAASEIARKPRRLRWRGHLVHRDCARGGTPWRTAHLLRQWTGHRRYHGGDDRRLHDGRRPRARAERRQASVERILDRIRTGQGDDRHAGALEA